MFSGYFSRRVSCGWDFPANRAFAIVLQYSQNHVASPVENFYVRAIYPSAPDQKTKAFPSLTSAVVCCYEGSCSLGCLEARLPVGISE